MRSRRRFLPKVVCLEERTVPANILQVEPIWINPPHVREFTPSGTFVGQITPPLGDPRDVVVSPNGDIQVFDGTFSPQLDTYNPTTGTWSSRTTTGWSTVNNLSYGGIAAYGDYVYVTDMQTAYETPPFNGIIRFNMADDTVERFAGGHDFIAMCLGLDGYLYAMGGQTGMGNNIYKYDPITMDFLGTFLAPVPDGRGVAVGANGDYYVADWGNTVNRYDSAGNFIQAQNAGNGAVDVSLDGQVISGNVLMDLALNIVGTVGDGNYHASFATPQIPILTPILSKVETTLLTYTENAPATAISETIELTDTHSTTIAGATIAIVENFAAGEDELSFVNANGISGSYNSSTGVLTLSGTASVADYQAALRNVRYQNTSENPSTATRRVSFQVDDGASTHNLSNTVSRTIEITSINDNPAITLPAELVGYQDQALAVDGISVADVDAGNGPARLLLSVPRGGLSFTDLSSVTLVGGANGSSTIEIEGAIANLNQALRDGNIAFQADAGYTGDVVLSLTLDDRGYTGNGGSQTDSKNLTLHIAPTPQLILVAPEPLAYTEGRARRIASRIKAAAGDAIMSEAKVAITGNYIAGEDLLSLPARKNIASSFDPATGVLTLTGSAPVKQYQRALRAVRYSNTSQDPSTALRTISFRIDEMWPLNAWSNVVTRTLQPRTVNTAPVIALPPTALTTAQNVALAINGLAVADVDANGGTVRLTLRVARGTIQFNNLGGLTISEGANNSGMIALVGTLDELNAVLAADNLHYLPPPDFVGKVELQLTLNDLGHSGDGPPRVRQAGVRIRVV